MIHKNDRVYIMDWVFENGGKPTEGDKVCFDMPSFCSGDYEDYSAEIYFDSDNDPYINSTESYYEACRGITLITQPSYVDEVKKVRYTFVKENNGLPHYDFIEGTTRIFRREYVHFLESMIVKAKLI
ncbi:MAG: hypothetical protein GY827_04505 [Cytophagales bacterium]|nr:hypothetical protein [Cytophagales bacterium]